MKDPRQMTSNKDNQLFVISRYLNAENVRQVYNIVGKH